MRPVGCLWLLIAFCMFSSKPSLAWWTVLYPETAKEATVDSVEESQEKEKENSIEKKEEWEEQEPEKLEIRWKLAEWVVKWLE